jgi:SAM-dependent methyltransferase
MSSVAPVADLEATQPVMAASRWKSNADLIADVARLGYLRPEWRVLDPTWGRGKWWSKWRPLELVATDLRPANELGAPFTGGVDFRHLPFPSASFDAVTFDPPYVSVGGRSSTGMPDFHDRYGMTDAPSSPAQVQELINAGMAECRRVVRPGGTLLVKTQDYVSSGKLWPGTHHTLSAAFELELELVDRLEHISRPRPQPPRSLADGTPAPQRHARRNLSTLFVLRRPRRRPGIDNLELFEEAS